MSTDALDTITIGRAKDNVIVIDHPQVSRHHALVERLGTRHRIKDLKSANGVFVNDQRIEGETWLQEGDEIRIGTFKLRLAAGMVQQMAEEGVRIDALRLKKWVSKSKNLLQDISLSIHPQEFVALVGLSGAGKSTLMDAISGFRPATHGVVLANGINLYRNFDMFRNDMGYVPQQNIVHTDLTVYKALDYAAQLRMPADTSKEERHRRIMEVLDELDLTERQDLAIHKLSGGQIKRVSIGVELLTKPRLFFLDEPTSGLDPGTEYNMMRLLRKLADQGRTIVLITHATKNVMMCDKVLIIVRGGHIAFYGPPEEALAYFDQYRTDHERRIKDMEFDDTYTILEDEKRGNPEDWAKRYRQSYAYQKHVAGRFQELRQEMSRPKTASTVARKRPRVNTVKQFLILTRRYLDLVVRDRQLLTVLIAVMPIVGFLLLLISGPNWLVGDTPAEIERQLAADLAAGQSSATYAIFGQSQRLLFMLVLAAVLLGLFAAAYEIVKERAIYRRERMVTVRILPYLASKVVVLSAFALVQCFFLLLVVSIKVEFPAEGVVSAAMLEMYITLVAAALAAIMMGLLISALVPKTDTVIYVVFLTIFLQIIFAGVLFEMPGFAGNLSTLTLTRWGMEGLGTSVNMEELTSLTRTRFQPDPITREVSIPISVPQVPTSPEVPVGSTPTMTETMTQTVAIQPEPVIEVITHTEAITIESEPVDVFTRQEFQIEYTSTAAHLRQGWLILLGFGLVFGLGTIVVLGRTDAG
jgi:ABC-type multidrug transport system ATPase subunit